MMQAAVKSVRELHAKLGRPAPKLIAVTILTSMDDEQFGDLNYKNTIAEQVIALAKLAQEAGMDGVVASPQEAAGIRSACGPEFLIVTPGVRPAGASIDDQSRIATPAGAFKNGSSHIVVGRPITKAEDKIAAELTSANNIGTVDHAATVAKTAANGKTTYTISKGYATVADTLSFNLHVGADADMTNKSTSTLIQWIQQVLVLKAST